MSPMLLASFRLLCKPHHERCAYTVIVAAAAQIRILEEPCTLTNLALNTPLPRRRIDDMDLFAEKI